jgi:hypothetical protein
MIQKTDGINSPNDLEPSIDGYRGGKMLFMEREGVGMLWGRCVVSLKVVMVPVSKEKLAAYLAGGLAQDVFSELMPAAREFIISGTSPVGWDEVFPK